MYLLDTNVIAEPMRPVPHPTVQAWLSQQPEASVYLSVVSESELYFGLALLPNGKRKTLLAAQIDRVFAVFANRVLSFDRSCAKTHATLRARTRKSGHPMQSNDAMLAAIALTHKLTLVTRNVADFSHCGVHLINPWDAR